MPRELARRRVRPSSRSSTPLAVAAAAVTFFAVLVVLPVSHAEGLSGEDVSFCNMPGFGGGLGPHFDPPARAVTFLE